MTIDDCRQLLKASRSEGANSIEANNLSRKDYGMGSSLADSPPQQQFPEEAADRQSGAT